MLLALEIGNSNVVAGLFEGPELVHVERLPSRADAGAVERVFSRRPGEAVIAGVVPELCERWRAHCVRRGLPAKVVRQDLQPRLTVCYDPPQSLGIDRLLNAVGARRHGLPCLVADCGTATTVDAVGANGAFLGGTILPGVGLSADALHAHTALLPRIAPAAPRGALAHDTIAALQAGIVYGQVAAIAGLAERLRDEMGAPARLIGTGGWSALLAEAEPGLFDVVDPHLTLHGLRLLYEENGT